MQLNHLNVDLLLGAKTLMYILYVVLELWNGIELMRFLVATQKLIVIHGVVLSQAVQKKVNINLGAML